MFHYAAIIVLGFWCAGETGFARSQPSQESIAAGRLGGVVQQYIIRNDGVWPTNWAPLASGLLQKNAQLVANGKMPIEGTYVFVPTNFPPLDRPDGRVILAGYNSIEEDGLKGRYVVLQDPDQSCSASWVIENDFQALLIAFGGKLREPEKWTPKSVPAAKLDFPGFVWGEKRQSHEQNKTETTQWSLQSEGGIGSIAGH